MSSGRQTSVGGRAGEVQSLFTIFCALLSDNQRSMCVIHPNLANDGEPRLIDMLTEQATERSCKDNSSRTHLHVSESSPKQLRVASTWDCPNRFPAYVWF